MRQTLVSVTVQARLNLTASEIQRHVFLWWARLKCIINCEAQMFYMRKPVFAICGQQRCIPSAQSDQRLCCSLIRKCNIYIAMFKVLRLALMATEAEQAGLSLLFGFNGPSRRFPSFRAESIERWGENWRSLRKTTWPPTSRTWLVSDVTRAKLDSTAVRWPAILSAKDKQP